MTNGVSGQAGGLLTGGGLGAKLQGLFINSAMFVVGKVLDIFKPTVEDIMSMILEDTVEKAPEMLDDILNTLQTTGSISATFKSIKNLSARYKPLNTSGLQIALWGYSIYATFVGSIDILQRRFRLNLNTKFPSEILNIGDAVQAARRDIISWGDADLFAAMNGFPKGYVDIFRDASKPLPDINLLQLMLFRGVISREKVIDYLSKMGYDINECEQIVKVFPYLPNVPDLVRFAVREVYTPAIAQKYGQFEDFPAKFAEEAAKQGLSLQHAKDFWAAHWELPSIQMGYEMLHRGEITQEELMTLLRTADVMPFWREKLIAISYNVFHRVDIRRMYQTGILNKDQVLRGYKDIGYDDWHAARLAEFCYSLITQDEKDLTKAELLGGYKKGLLTEIELKENLVKMGYDRDEADFITLMADYDVDKSIKAEAIKVSHENYKKGLADEFETHRSLTEAGLSSGEIDRLFSLWNYEVKIKDKAPVLKDLKNWFMKKVIDVDTFVQECRNIGYPDRYIAFNINEMVYDMQRAAEKEQGGEEVAE